MIEQLGVHPRLAAMGGGHGFCGMQWKPLKRNNIEDLAGQTVRRLPSSAT